MNYFSIMFFILFLINLSCSDYKYTEYFQGKLVKINGTTKRRINTIRLINDIYQVTYRE